jgi:hypothetical protein
MRISIYIKTSIILTYLFCLSCKQDSDKIIGYIDKTPITYNEVDNTIRQELFDALNNIYFTRRIALDDFIKDKGCSLE